MNRRALLLRNAILTAAATAGSAAHAGVVYDLRFVDGSHFTAAILGGTHTIELWARVSGTNGTTTDDGITNSLITIVSTQTGGGEITAGGISAAILETPFNGTGSRLGTGSDLNGDGLADWGSISTGPANTNSMFARTSTNGGQHA